MTCDTLGERRRAHFARRLRERYGLDPAPDALGTLLRRCRKHCRRHCRRLGEEPPGERVRRAVRFRGRWVLVVYDPARRELVTALPAARLPWGLR